MKRRWRNGKRPLPVSEDYLKDLASVTLLLENDEQVRFKIAREVRIPSDPDRMIEAARKAPARLAFWAYQSERALASLRKAERECAKVEGYSYQVYRKYFEDNVGIDPTEAMIRSSVDQDGQVRTARIALSSRKKEYGILRAVRDAIDQRTWMLRTLLQHHET